MEFLYKYFLVIKLVFVNSISIVKKFDFNLFFFVVLIFDKIIMVKCKKII